MRYLRYMKTLSISLLLIITCSFAKAQLAGTKWTGTMLVPEATSVSFDFKKDTLNLIINDSGEIVETMTYTVKDDIITIKKLEGHSPCDEGSLAVLKYAIKNDLLTVTVVSDACDDRKGAWPTEPMK